jgi:hypothetical protein
MIKFPKNPFMIFAHARCGSTQLTKILNTNDIKTMYEPFSRGYHKGVYLESFIENGMDDTLKSIMSGSRKYRSGTMNPSLIMSSFVATVQTFENRQEKTTYLRNLRTYLLSKLNSSINIVNVLDNYEMVNTLKSKTLPTVIVCMIRNTKWHLPNTLFIANNIEENLHPGVLDKTIFGLEYINTTYNYKHILRTNISSFFIK